MWCRLRRLIELTLVATDHCDALVGVQPRILGVVLEVAVVARAHHTGLRVALLKVEEVAHALLGALHLGLDHAGRRIGFLPALSIVGEGLVTKRQLLVAELDVFRVLLEARRPFEDQAAHRIRIAHCVAEHGAATQ